MTLSSCKTETVPIKQFPIPAPSHPIPRAPGHHHLVSISEFDFFGYCLGVDAYSVCLLVTGVCAQVTPMLQPVTGFPSFKRLNVIPVYALQLSFQCMHYSCPSYLRGIDSWTCCEYQYPRRFMSQRNPSIASASISEHLTNLQF